MHWNGVGEKSKFREKKNRAPQAGKLLTLNTISPSRDNIASRTTLPKSQHLQTQTLPCTMNSSLRKTPAHLLWSCVQLQKVGSSQRWSPLHIDVGKHALEHSSAHPVHRSGQHYRFGCLHGVLVRIERLKGQDAKQVRYARRVRPRPA